MEKQDYAKDFKDLYLPKNKPAIVEVGTVPFIIISGKGDPNGKEFGELVGALYSFAYTIKFSNKGAEVPPGYYDYRVFPLEGVWDLGDKTISISDKSNYVYTMMIRQPDFVNEALFEKTREVLKKKKPNRFLDKAVLGADTEGLCCQMMHFGSYDAEPASFAQMMEYCNQNGYIRTEMTHREIYLSDPSKTEPSKCKTVLRFKVAKG
ncbi:MAG: GyrI-like domain-containing protein [Eubacteriales bacterium]